MQYCEEQGRGQGDDLEFKLKITHSSVNMTGKYRLSRTNVTDKEDVSDRLISEGCKEKMN